MERSLDAAIRVEAHDTDQLLQIERGVAGHGDLRIESVSRPAQGSTSRLPSSRWSTVESDAISAVERHRGPLTLNGSSPPGARRRGDPWVVTRLTLHLLNPDSRLNVMRAIRAAAVPPLAVVKSDVARAVKLVAPPASDLACRESPI